MNEKLTLVLMAGLPGAGKSTLACALKDSLRWHVIDKDTSKQKLLNQGMNEEKAGREAYKRSFKTAYNKLALQKKSVIFDSAALDEFILENARRIVASIPNAQLKTILCVADRDLRNQRLLTRPSQITNIRVDPATGVDYFKLFKHLPSDRLTLFTSEPLDNCLEEVNTYLLGQQYHKSERNENFLKLVEALMKR